MAPLRRAPSSSFLQDDHLDLRPRPFSPLLLDSDDTMAAFSFAPFTAFNDGTDLIPIRDARRSPTLVHNVVEFQGQVADVVRPSSSSVPSVTAVPSFSSSGNTLKPWSTPRQDRRRAPRPPPNVFTLLPLHVAAARSDIKYRCEGFEMAEARRRLRAVRQEVVFDEELALRCYM